MESKPDASPQQEPLDRREVERLFRRFYGSVKAYFRRRGLSEDDALELAQTAFLRVGKSAGPRHGEKERAWILVIAANVLKSHWRDRGAGKRQGTEVALQGLEDQGESLLAQSEASHRVASQPPQPLDGLLRKEQREKLRQAVALLPEQRRACLDLYMFQELKYSEIASILCIGVGTVKSQIFEARKTLKNELGSTFGLDQALEEGGTS